MKSGKLYKIAIDDLHFIKKLNNVVCGIPKNTILTCLETKWGYSGEDCYFLYNGEIFYRQIYNLDEWLEEVETE